MIDFAQTFLEGLKKEMFILQRSEAGEIGC